MNKKGIYIQVSNKQESTYEVKKYNKITSPNLGVKQYPRIYNYLIKFIFLSSSYFV